MQLMLYLLWSFITFSFLHSFYKDHFDLIVTGTMHHWFQQKQSLHNDVALQDSSRSRLQYFLKILTWIFLFQLLCETVLGIPDVNTAIAADQWL